MSTRRHIHVNNSNFPHPTRSDLTGLKPEKEFFVGIDSDGCVFDTMEIKQKRCFHPLIVSHWRLQPIEKYVRECAEFVNLRSRWRGTNRYPCLYRTFELLRGRPEVIRSGAPLPDFMSFKAFLDSGVPLGHPALKTAVAETGDPELASVLKWSEAVNASIAGTARSIPPFHWAKRSLETIAKKADAIVVSQTPTEALIREWEENGMTGLVRVIAGQELGTKAEHISMATAGRYPPERILMIGDAPGDLQAARANKARFFPIEPGREEASWEHFHREAFDRFLAGRYTGEYELDLIARFEALLPENPPWE